MAHPKIKNTITFTDKFGEILNLSDVQIKKIDNLTYELLKKHQFSIDPDYDEKKERKQCDKSVQKILSKEQRVKLKKVRKNTQEKQSTIDFETQKFKRLQEKYKSLQLTEKKLHILQNILNDIREVVFAKWGKYVPGSKNQLSKHELYLNVASKKLSGFLSEEKLAEFYKIEASEQKWLKKIHTEQIVNMNASLNLTSKQAEFIYDYEENEPSKDINNDYLSEFEKWDLKREFMSSILDKKQFKEYLRLSEKQKAAYISYFKETDNLKSKEVKRLKSRVNYLINNYLYVLCEWRLELETYIPKSLNLMLLDFRLKYHENLKKDLNKNLKQSIRHNKNHVPNDLIFLKLRTKNDAIVPHLHCITNLENNIITEVPKKLCDLIVNKPSKVRDADAKLHEFTITNYENHGGTYGGSTYIRRKNRDEIDSKLDILSILLLHPEPQKNIDAGKKFD
ncbi:hypothetical protein [Costertonia aggregata]|uniref:Uncharacterized protein n=1 Tax=Costertonia aggregata TaxID=343403 RepID=A0A7H9AQA5_9FLAO|nr:hypothetical protein [Costertonia aggregata]QLG45628.1 hypothetical protein HYG79_09805 [Costertonia aggregata]